MVMIEQRSEKMVVLVCNVGSTSLKFKLFEMPSETLLAESKIERVGSNEDAIFYYCNIKKDITIKRCKESITDYQKGIDVFLRSLLDHDTGVVGKIEDINAIGFKTVLAKGYHGIHEINDNVLKAMEDYLFVAPAHNGPYLKAIRVFKKMLPDTPMVAVFETAFHTTIPLEKRMYSIPYEWYECYGIQRMGYHGASQEYIAQRIVSLEGSTGRLISCHLGGSSSVCAISDGVSVDSSFGFSLQTGVPHANRAGDVDPYIIPYLLNEGLSMDEIIAGLSNRGGLFGISGTSGDMRIIENLAAEGNRRARLAIDVFVYGVIRHIGSCFAGLGGLDCLVFTGGIGENSVRIRKMVCNRLSHMGIYLDDKSNETGQGERLISIPESPVKIYVIPTNEEIGVARKTFDIIRN
ncbi:MAG: acetate/propionate family kinase [Acetivibrionales bacterium]|jgi:acetate kinase